MPVVALIFGLAATVWGLIWARRTSLLVGCGLLLVVGYVLGHEFWNLKIGPLPITLDRAVLVLLLAAFVIQWRMGRIQFQAMTGTDYLLAALLALLVVSALFSGTPDITSGVTSKWGRLMASFLLPAVLYWLIRQLPINFSDWSQMLAVLVGLGVYLAVTGVLEVAHCWSLVFPRYISNPSLGIHFGRARGPELNSVSLGMYLTACFLCAAALLPQVRQRWQQVALICAGGVTTLGVLLTYTRSTWIGFGVSAIIVAAFWVPRHLRLPAFAFAAVAGLLFVAVGWSHVVGLQREGTVEDSEHSIDQRGSFLYISWQMFCDHPIFGVGFDRFYDKKMPYLSDRRQTVELESIRGLHHHNTLLSILTETGIVGFFAFISVLIAWTRSAWRLATNVRSTYWIRMQGILMLALMANYMCSAVFHDVTLLPSQELILFVFAALTVNLLHSTQNLPRLAVFESETCGSHVPGHSGLAQA
jgi:O-antigen ligase